MKFFQSVMIVVGLLVAIIGLTVNFLDLANDPQKLRLFSLIGYTIFAIGILWFAFTSKHVSQVWRWVALGLLFLITIPFFIWVGTWIVTPVPVDNFNPLISYHHFEIADNGWSDLEITILDENGISVKALSDGQNFPGSIKREISSEHALAGNNSLKITTSVTAPGTYRGYVYRLGSINSYGIAMYVMLPKDVAPNPIEYIQICIPSNEWICSAGTDIVPGEWTPIVIDLSQENEEGDLYNQKITELAVQWRFSTESSTSFPLYFDAVEIYRSGTY